MSRFGHLDNFIDNLELLFRRVRAKLKRVQTETSSPQLEAPLSDSEGKPSIVQNLTPEFDAMANKSLCEFSALIIANIRTGPVAEIEQNFEVKPALIDMVQASQFCGKAHEDASAHLQHFLEINNTFTIKDVPRDAILLRLFPFSLLGRAKQWFYANKEKNTMWALCSTNFLVKFFPSF
jgi:hypothetical protein